MPNLVFPEEPGNYLFYFGKSKFPFYEVDEVRFDHFKDPYLVNYAIEYVTHWWHLPVPNKFPE